MPAPKEAAGTTDAQLRAPIPLGNPNPGSTHPHRHHHPPTSPSKPPQPPLDHQYGKGSPMLKAVRTVSPNKAAVLETLIRGSWAPNAIYSLCRLGVPDVLSDDPASAATPVHLAAKLHCNAPCLRRLLRLCTAYGLLVEVPVSGLPVGGAAETTQAGRRNATAESPMGQWETPRKWDDGRADGCGGWVAGGEGNGDDGCGGYGRVGESGDGEQGGEEDANGGGCLKAATAFYLTDIGMMLQENHPSQMKWLALMLGLPGHYASRGYLYDNVKKGRMGLETAFGCDWYNYVGANPLEAAAFNRAMTASSSATAAALAQGYDFSRHSTVMDVGGGQGLLMTSILMHHPAVSRGYVLELPAVVAAARQLGQQGLERLEYVEGDFFHPFPQSVDCLVMRLVLHDWPDAQAAVILRNAGAALRSARGSARLVVMEAVLPEVVGQWAGRAAVEQLEFDMGMMLMTPGRERCRSEWEALLESAGFELEEVRPPPGARLQLMVARLA